MPRLYGFCKTLRLPVLMTTPVAGQFQATTDLFREVVEYYLLVFREHLELLEDSRWLTAAERLTHRTAKNPSPLYHDFDDLFPNLPSGFRRAAIAEAYGLALAWRENYRRWQRSKEKTEEKNQRRGLSGKKPIRFTKRPPQFPEASRSWLTYYGTEFRILDERHLLLKVATGASYIYRKVALARPWEIPMGYAAGSPTLVKKKSGWEVHFPLFLQEKQDLRPAAELMQDQDTRICAVDLGLSHHAVMTIQDTEGRVLATPGTTTLGSSTWSRSSGCKRKQGLFPRGKDSPQTFGTRLKTWITTSPTGYPGVSWILRRNTAPR